MPGKAADKYVIVLTILIFAVITYFAVGYEAFLLKQWPSVLGE